MKNGRYAIYKGKEYPIFNGEVENKNGIILLSHNRSDLQLGFVLSYSEKYMKEHNFFTCEKEVPKSEITEAYAIRSHAVYKGVGATIIGCLKENWIGLRTCCLDGENIKDFLKEVNEAGFEYITTEQGGTDVYGLDVSLDDPDLQIIEKRTELDISKL